MTQNKVKIAIIFGTRPEAVKMAPVIAALKKRPQVELEVCVTAQHRRMLDETLATFDIVPDTDLDLMRPGQTLAQLTSRAVVALDEYLGRKKPDIILVQGDTTTVLCGALSAFYHKIRIGHVEAGLRTYHRYSPFPEEMNRVLTSHLADWHFAPTETARQCLLKEGIEEARIFVTGNTVIDALYQIREKVKDRPLNEMPELQGLSAKFQFPDTKIILVTGHRRESFGEGFRQICLGIKRIAQGHPEVQVIYPVHLNPNVQEPVRQILGDLGNVHLIEPLSYLPFVKLMDAAYIILTDSGGIQEEAPALGKPVLVMREVTERPEAVAAGVVKLVGPDAERIYNEAGKLLSDEAEYKKMARGISPYGDGRAAERIVDILLKH